MDQQVTPADAITELLRRLDAAHAEFVGLSRSNKDDLINSRISYARGVSYYEVRTWVEELFPRKA